MLYTMLLHLSDFHSNIIRILLLIMVKLRLSGVVLKCNKGGCVVGYMWITPLTAPILACMATTCLSNQCTWNYSKKESASIGLQHSSSIDGSVLCLSTPLENAYREDIFVAAARKEFEYILT